jgi:hypothetical protein
MNLASNNRDDVVVKSAVSRCRFVAVSQAYFTAITVSQNSSSTEGNSDTRELECQGKKD